MSRRASGTTLVVLGIVTALLSNYWMLEGAVADHSDPAASWISDLAARTQDTWGLFSVLDGLSGLALGALTVALWPYLAGRSRLVWWGMVALAVVAVTTVIDGAAPLSCAPALPPECTSDNDVLDRLHALESGVNVVATIAAFAALGVGLWRDRELGQLGVATVGFGVTWVFLYVLVVAADTFDAFGDVKGSFQRPAQVVFGVWIALLAAGAARRR